MHERIQKLRKALGLTQQEFSDKLNISRANIAGYETGRREPSDAAISLMCREFNVEEAWLREGTGNMFVDLSRNDELSVFFADLIDSDDEFKQPIHHGYCKARFKLVAHAGESCPGSHRAIPSGI